MVFQGALAIGLWQNNDVCVADGAITVENNVAYIDYNKCRMCRKCVAVCPTGAIHELNFPPRKEKTEAAPASEAASEKNTTEETKIQ